MAGRGFEALPRDDPKTLQPQRAQAGDRSGGSGRHRRNSGGLTPYQPEDEREICEAKPG